MNTRTSAWTTVALSVVVPVWLLASPAAAQTKGGSSGGGSSSSGGGSHASSGGSGGGGGHASSGGGGGGGHVSSGGGGGARTSSGGATSRSASAPGSHSNGSSGGSTTRGAVQRGPVGANDAAARSAGSNGTAVTRGTTGTDANNTVPPHARPRDGQPTIGTAVPRTGAPPNPSGPTAIYVPGYYGYYPYGIGGLGFIGGYYGGYGYGGYDDPYGADPGYQSAPGRSDDSGGLKLKIKPSEATVYVDGYYVGLVNDFDGAFQKLTIEPGAHRVEVRAPGYETLTFDIRIESGHTTTYRGEMKKEQP